MKNVLLHSMPQIKIQDFKALVKQASGVELSEPGLKIFQTVDPNILKHYTASFIVVGPIEYLVQFSNWNVVSTLHVSTKLVSAGFVILSTDFQSWQQLILAGSKDVNVQAVLSQIHSLFKDAGYAPLFYG